MINCPNSNKKSRYYTAKLKKCREHAGRKAESMRRECAEKAGRKAERMPREYAENSAEFCRENAERYAGSLTK